MFYVVIITLISFYTQINAILVTGSSFVMPSQTIAHLLGDFHPCIHKQDEIKEQLSLIDMYVALQPKKTVVMLNEEPARCLVEHWKSKKNDETLTGIRAIAESHGVQYENVDLRASFLAAASVLCCLLDNRPSKSSLLFGHDQHYLKSTHEVTLNDLFEEKKHYIARIEGVSTWSDVEQQQANRLEQALFQAIGSSDLSMKVQEFCEKVHDREKVHRVEKAARNLDCYLFDAYARKKLLYYSSNHTVIFAAGSQHVLNIRDYLIGNLDLRDNLYLGDQNCDDYHILSPEKLKKMLGLWTFKDQLKKIFCCQQVSAAY